MFFPSGFNLKIFILLLTMFWIHIYSYLVCDKLLSILYGLFFSLFELRLLLLSLLNPRLINSFDSISVFFLSKNTLFKLFFSDLFCVFSDLLSVEYIIMASNEISYQDMMNPLFSRPSENNDPIQIDKLQGS